MVRRVVQVILIVTWGVVLPSAVTQETDKEKPASDFELVKELLVSRQKYQRTLEKLRAHYIKVGDMERARWAEGELRSYHRTPKQAYRLDMDVPIKELKAQRNIPEANELYRKAMIYKDKGWGVDFIDNQRRSELLLRRLLAYYPESDKIADAAYQLGDIYEDKPYRQYRRSAVYFERAFQWDTNTHLDARLRAARLYDAKLNQQDRARNLYRLVLKHETDPKRLQEARKRLQALSR